MKSLVFLFSFISLLSHNSLQGMQQNFPKNTNSEKMSYLQGGALVAACGFIGWSGYTIYQYHTNFDKFIRLDAIQMRHELNTRPHVIHQALDPLLPPVLSNIVKEYDALSPEEENKEFWKKAKDNYYFDRHPDIKKMKRYGIFAGCATAFLAAIGLSKAFNFTTGK